MVPVAAGVTFEPTSLLWPKLYNSVVLNVHFIGFDAKIYNHKWEIFDVFYEIFLKNE